MLTDIAALIDNRMTDEQVLLVQTIEHLKAAGIPPTIKAVASELQWDIHTVKVVCSQLLESGDLQVTR